MKKKKKKIVIYLAHQIHIKNQKTQKKIIITIMKMKKLI